MLKELLIVFGVPIARSFFGWLPKALEDKEVTHFELRQLASTVTRVIFYSGVAYFGINALGLDVGAMGASCGAVAFDMVIRALKKSK